MSRFESGASPIRSKLLLGLLDHYGVEGFGERDEILELCDDVANHGWWDPFKTYLTAEFADYLWVEERATVICLVDVVLIHGLLQTPDYASALINDDPSLDDNLAVRRLTELRIARQRILTNNQAPNVTSILHEAALYHRVGDRKVIKVQLDLLITQAENPNIKLRLLPLGTWMHGIGSLGTGLAKYQMPSPYPTVGYTENVSGLVCHMDEHEMDRIERMYVQMESQALTPDATTRKIKSIAKEIWSSMSALRTRQTRVVITWRKSSRSPSNGGNCVEAGTCPCHGIAVRDSKHLATPPLALTHPCGLDRPPHHRPTAAGLISLPSTT